MSSSSPSPRPIHVLWLQLALRALALLLVITTIIIAIVVSASHHRTWYTVFISAFVSLIVNIAETIALASRYLGKAHGSVPRMHPVFLIALDFSTLCLLIWSFFALFLDAWGMHENKNSKPYTATIFDVVETWFAVAIGMRQKVVKPKPEYRPKQRKRATARSRDDLFDMDW